MFLSTDREEEILESMIHPIAIRKVFFSFHEQAFTWNLLPLASFVCSCQYCMPYVKMQDI